MKAEWTIDKKVLQNIQTVIDNNIEKQFVKERIRKNVEKQDIDLSRNTIWKVLVGCEITTQQKSGAGSPVDNFLKSNNIVLFYEKCINLSTNEISNELSKNHLRNNIRIANFLKEIINNFENGEWEVLLKKLNSLIQEHTIQDEIDVFPVNQDLKFRNSLGGN